MKHTDPNGRTWRQMPGTTAHTSEMPALRIPAAPAPFLHTTDAGGCIISDTPPDQAWPGYIILPVVLYWSPADRYGHRVATMHEDQWNELITALCARLTPVTTIYDLVVSYIPGSGITAKFRVARAELEQVETLPAGMNVRLQRVYSLGLRDQISAWTVKPEWLIGPGKV